MRSDSQRILHIKKDGDAYDGRDTLYTAWPRSRNAERAHRDWRWVIIVPALLFLFGFSQYLAQGTTLALMVLPIGLPAARHATNRAT